MYGAAVASGEFKKAIQNLDKIWELHGGTDVPERLSAHLHRYAMCSHRMGDVAKCAQYIVPSWETAKMCDQQTQFNCFENVCDVQVSG